MDDELKKFMATGTYQEDPDFKAYYFKLDGRMPGPYLKQVTTEAILDIASDGTLAGIELVYGNLPPPPKNNNDIETRMPIFPAEWLE